MVQQRPRTASTTTSRPASQTSRRTTSRSTPVLATNTTSTTTTTTASSQTQPLPKQQQPQQQRQQQQQQHAPWKADYYTSYRSQQQIQRHRQNGPRALQTLLSLPPTACNGANICCALTLSAAAAAQTSSSSSSSSSTTTTRPLLYRVVQIVHDLLLEQQQDSTTNNNYYFTLRQLSNVAWALAKHYDRDHGLMTTSPPLVDDDDADDDTDDDSSSSSSSTTTTTGAALLATTIDVLATTLTQAMSSSSSSNNSSNSNNVMKEQELCMTSWAYGILRRRRRPPGWQQRPVVGRVVAAAEEEEEPTTTMSSSSSFSFVQVDDWNTSNNDSAATATPSTVSTAVSTSTLHTPTGRLLDAIGTAFCERNVDDDENPYPRIRNCQWRELANVIWAFASHGRAGGSPITVELAGAVADEATRRLVAAPALSRDIAQIIWSLGVLQADDYRIADPLVRFVEAFAATMRPRVFRSWSCADLVQVALSLAHARLDETALMTALYAEASERLLLLGDDDDEALTTHPTSLQTVPSAFSQESRRKSFYAWEISILLWAQARLYLTQDQHPIFQTFQERSVVQLQRALHQGATFSSLGVGPQEQANIAWSIAVLTPQDQDNTANSDAATAVSAILRAIFEEAATNCQAEGVIQLEHAHQLWQALFLLEPSYTQCFQTVPDWFRTYLEEQWKEEKTRPKVSSARHRALSKTLNLMGVAHFNEHDEDIDVAIVLEEGANWTHETVNSQVKEGMKVAVEFDGPVHFTRQKFPPVIGPDGKPIPPRALGPTVLKYRLLKQQGWSVVRVPYYEFDKIPFWASMERQRYVQRLLKTHGSLKFSDVDISAYTPAVANRLSRFD